MIGQLAFFSYQRRQAVGGQMAVQLCQAHTLAGQHHKAAWLLVLCVDLFGQPNGQGFAFGSLGFAFFQFAGGAQAVAPLLGSSGVCFGFFWAAKKLCQNLPSLLAFGAVGAKTGHASTAQHTIDGIHHRAGVAPRVVAAEQCATQVLHQGLRVDKDPWLGIAKAVNALFGVAHDEQARHVGAAARTRIIAQPFFQNLPLQRAGVLKFINQQMPYLRVELLLHPSR